MSFILDALKKSDAERQKRSTPGFADIPVSRDRKTPPRWLWVVGGLLAVNLVAVVVLLVRPDTPLAADESTASERIVPPAGEARRPFADIVAEARQKAEQPPAAAVRRDSRPGAATTARSAAAPDGQEIAAEVSATPPGDAPNEAKTAVPTNTFESMRADGTLALPDLHLDIHVYSDQSAERFVFINTKKYRENETLAEGPTIRQIAPEGVILEHRGNIFLLPRE
jgi:general secretion pathway protein B